MSQLLAPDTPASNGSLLYDLVSSQGWALVAVAFALIIITTRIASSSSSFGKPSASKQADHVPTVPYWIPFIGHVPNMIWDPTGFTRRLRSTYSNGAYSINLGGTVHNILYRPSLVTALLNTKDSNAAHEEMAEGMLERVFGFPMSTERETYRAAYPEIMTCYRHLLGEPSLGNMVARTAEKVKDLINDFVTFSPSLVDQAHWERTSGAEVKKDENGDVVVEADMLHLVRDFCAAAANPSIIGSNFISNFPDFFADVWVVDRAFLLLAAGLPRWVPIPPVTRAHIARRRILESLTKFEEAIDKWMSGEDPGPEWRDMDDVGPVVKGRIEAYRKNDMSMKGRAALEFALLWATNANSNMLVFWMLNRIYCDKALLAKIREEIAPYIRAVQPRQQFPVPEQPHLDRFDVEGLCNGTPLLKSCYVECLRLDAASWSLKVVKQDFILSGREKDSKAFVLRRGEFVHAAHDLHNTNPEHFPKPDEWKADRHVKRDSTDNLSVDLGTIRPYGGGTGMCKGRSFAFKECMLFTAAMIALWDMEPARGGAWKIPSHKKATGVYSTSDQTRVWVRRRKLPTVD